MCILYSQLEPNAECIPQLGHWTRRLFWLVQYNYNLDWTTTICKTQTHQFDKIALKSVQENYVAIIVGPINNWVEIKRKLIEKYIMMHLKIQ